MVIADNCQHPAVWGGSGGVGMLQYVHRPVEAGALAVPNPENTVELAAGVQFDMLGSPNCRRAQFLIYAGDKFDVVGFQQRFGPPQFLIIGSKR